MMGVSSKFTMGVTPPPHHPPCAHLCPFKLSGGLAFKPGSSSQTLLAALDLLSYSFLLSSFAQLWLAGDGAISITEDFGSNGSIGGWPATLSFFIPVNLLLWVLLMGNFELGLRDGYEVTSTTASTSVTVVSAYNFHGYKGQPAIVATKIMSQNLH